MAADDELVAAVAAVLEAAVAAGAGRGEAERLAFAFDILLNALTSVLEEIRAQDPEAHDRFRALALAILADD